MTRQWRIWICAAAWIACATGTAHAWNGVGHMVVGKLAFDRLSEAERDRLEAAFRAHPHYEKYLSADRPESIDPRAWVVMRAGVWSDWIRPPKRLQQDPDAHPVYRFHRATWHYSNFPYVAHQPGTALPAEPLAQKTDILQQLVLSRRFAAAVSGPDDDAEPETTFAENRAVRLCWLIHLVGDLHQPLHAATLVDERRLPGPTHGDQGGNLLAVRVEIGAYPIKLHALWDQLLGTDNHPDSVVRLADDLSRNVVVADEAATFAGDESFRAWAAESYSAAIRYAYLNGDLPTAVWDETRPPLPPIDDVPILPVGVEREARRVARERVVSAGKRLATLLSQAVAE